MVQAPQELKRLKTGEEKRFYESLVESKKIIHSSIDDIKNVLKFIFVKIGLRAANFPSDEEKGVLIDHILKYYGGHTCKELQLAFEMAMAGKLDVDSNCYENFSCLYFSKIMNSYRKWAEQVYDQIPAYIPENSLENKRVLTDEDMESWVRETSAIVTDIEKIWFVPIEVYEWLLSKKKIKINQKQRDEYLQTAIKLRHEQLVDSVQKSIYKNIENRLAEFNRMKGRGEFDKVESLAIKNIAKKIAVFNYFKSLKNISNKKQEKK